MDLTKARLGWVELYAQTGDAGLVCRRCGISRPTLREWWRRYQAAGPAGLVEQSRRPRHLAAQKVFADHEKLISAFDVSASSGSSSCATSLSVSTI